MSNQTKIKQEPIKIIRIYGRKGRKSTNYFVFDRVDRALPAAAFFLATVFLPLPFFDEPFLLLPFFDDPFFLVEAFFFVEPFFELPFFDEPFLLLPFDEPFFDSSSDSSTADASLSSTSDAALLSSSAFFEPFDDPFFDPFFLVEAFFFVVDFFLAADFFLVVAFFEPFFEPINRYIHIHVTLLC
jgi:hypothetical protein